MNKVRKIVLFIIVLAYILLLIFKVPIPRTVFLGILGLILLNNGYEQIILYKKSKSKVNLIIPIGNFLLIILCAILIVRNRVISLACDLKITG
ncbi:MAG: hypothetical protein Q4E02_03685 [Lagierella massiliensis]|nr:hypothetical protein [Lagierella massiliensis]